MPINMLELAKNKWTIVSNNHIKEVKKIIRCFLHLKNQKMVKIKRKVELKKEGKSDEKHAVVKGLLLSYQLI